MTKIAFVTILLTLISLNGTMKSGFSCFRFLKEGNGFYNLEKVFSKSLTIDSISGLAGSLQLNLCHESVPKNCKSDWNSIGYIINGDTCTPLSYGQDLDTNKHTNWGFFAINPVENAINFLTGLSQTLVKNFLKPSVNKYAKLQLHEGVVATTTFAKALENPDLGKKKGLRIIGNNTDNSVGYNLDLTLNCDETADKIKGTTAIYITSTKTLTVT